MKKKLVALFMGLALCLAGCSSAVSVEGEDEQPKTQETQAAQEDAAPAGGEEAQETQTEIGRASCRERVWRVV